MAGPAAVGYDENATYREFIATDVNAEMNGQHPSAYIRVPFTLNRPWAVRNIVLAMQYDDGFVVWVNGVRVAERNAPGDIAWDAVADSSRPDADAVIPEEIRITLPAKTLRVGANVLAIQGLNAEAGSSDFLIVPVLRAFVP